MIARAFAEVGYVPDGKGVYWAPEESICLDVESVAADLFAYLTLLVRRREKLRGRGAANLGAAEACRDTVLAIEALKRCLASVVRRQGWRPLVRDTVGESRDSLAEAIDCVSTWHELLHWTPSESGRPEYDALGVALAPLEAFARTALEP